MTISLRRILGRVMLSTSALFLLAGVLPAQGPVGKWNANMDFGGQAIEASFTISRGPDGALTGVWSGQRGEDELSNVKFEDGKLTFTRTLSFNDQSIELAFEGTIEGDTVRGMFITDFGEMPIDGTRAEAETAPSSPLVGAWNVTSISQLGELKRKLIVADDLSATYESDEAKWTVTNLELDGEDVTFSVTVDIQGQALPLDFAGKLSGTTLEGTYSSDALGADVADVTAVKVNTALVLFVTTLGEFEVEIQTDAAPITSANFLHYVDGGFYDGGSFHRAVRLDNQRRSDVLIEVIQGAVKTDQTREGNPAIELERTNLTGLKHLDGTISMARGGPDSATSGFFICIGDQPSLDFGGNRNADGQGFAAFGAVVRGMDAVRKIQQSPTEGETLTPPIQITSARRIR